MSISKESYDFIVIFQECLDNTAIAATEDIFDGCEDNNNCDGNYNGNTKIGLYRSKEERETCRKLVEALPQDLQVHAAHTSYAYWYLSTQQINNNSNNNNDTTTTTVRVPTDDDQIYAAMKEARRHYVYMNRDFDKALKNLTESCQYRKEHKIDFLRTCFDSNHVYLDDVEDETKAKYMADLVRLDMSCQYHICRGQDKYGQAMMIKYPRTKPDTTEEAYVMSQIYMAERSIATTEFLSRGKKERSVAVYNYLGFDRAMSPPFTMQVSAATKLQTLFPERLQTLVFVEPPFWLKGILGLLKPFLSESITERIQWATGIEERETVFRKLICNEEKQNDWHCQATKLMSNDGRLTEPVSLEHFLVDVPFFNVYDSVPCQREITNDELELDRIAHTFPDPTQDGPSIAEQASNWWGNVTSSLSFGTDEEKK